MELELRSEARRGDDGAATRIRSLLRRKQSEKRRLEQEISELQAQAAPLVDRIERVRALAGEIHALLREAVRRRGLSRRDRGRIEALHRELEQDVLGPDPTAETELAEVCDCPACGAPAGEPGAPAGSAGETDRNGAVAPAPSVQRDPSLRDLYRALALRFHPDRADSDEVRGQHNERMREINAAFHSGDTERLLALSQELGVDTAALRNSHGVIGELVAQYERVKAEVRALRESPPGQLAVETRRAQRQGYCPPLETMREELDEQIVALGEIRDHVGQFVAGALGVDDLLAGPSPFGDDDEEDLFLTLVALVEDDLVAGPAATAMPRRRGRRRKRRPNGR